MLALPIFAALAMLAGERGRSWPGSYGLGRTWRPGARRRHHRHRTSGGAASRYFLDGIWLALIGWFVGSAATAQARAAVASASLAGVRVAEIMTPRPGLAPGRDSVAEFTREAARSRQDAFPVVGSGGELTGLVLTS
jgi:hypothetical protein